MNDFMENLWPEILNSTIGDATNEDIKSTSKMLGKYLDSIKDDKGRKKKTKALMDFSSFITMTAILLDMRDMESEWDN